MRGWEFTKYSYIHKCTSKTCLLSKKFLKPSDQIVSTVTYHSYPCIYKDDYPAICNCNFLNLSPQQLNVTLAKHRNYFKM